MKPHPTLRTLCCLSVTLVGSLATGALAQTSQPVTATTAAALMRASARENAYTYLFFWSRDDQQTQTMRQVFHKAVRQLGDSVHAIDVNIADAREEEIVDHFGVSRAPMPLALAVAPNGAVTGAFPVRFTTEQLAQAKVSPATQACMNALQHRKLVLLAIQNASTTDRQAAYHGASEFQRDIRFATSTELVTIDPDDPAEAGFLRRLKVAPQTRDAVTIVLAPPGTPIATFTGAVSREQIVEKVTAARNSCCPGGKCGPGGCCPGGKCGPEGCQPAK
ncbi:hypothetical protein Pan216_38340 [Planctomycetes bacterium Pan216]|uniref:Thioredoxin domain-containing protein n=1 Tax=Kolteria novifilia TaxID=2527975 RepID=A0A518B7K4_9BACT|nr:hypothetical protein Pan216_38340 [Planctomycetes bacterium Pan216]